jgi:hypothetical protein
VVLRVLNLDVLDVIGVGCSARTSRTIKSLTRRDVG